jgi:hypothetical protein
MHTIRLFIVFLVLVAMVVAFSPANREQAHVAWENARPVVVSLMDGMYAAVRTLIAGNDRHNRMDDNPGSPGGDFDRIVTMSPMRPS